MSRKHGELVYEIVFARGRPGAGRRALQTKSSVHKLVVNKQREPFDVYIGRPPKWGNPFSHRPRTPAIYKTRTRDEAIDAYREWLLAQPALVAEVRRELRGKVLGCWCAPLACHGDVLAAIANEVTPCST